MRSLGHENIVLFPARRGQMLSVAENRLLRGWDLAHARQMLMWVVDSACAQAAYTPVLARRTDVSL